MPRQLITTKPVSALAASAARISIVFGVVFLVLLVSLHFLEPEFDPTWRFISEYALGSVGWLMNLAFLALAISLVSACVAIFSQVRVWYGYIGIAGLIVAATGLTIAAIYRTDPITTSP